MGKIPHFLFTAVLILVGSICFSQTVKISDPHLELRDNKILITYDILNSNTSDTFIVELVVKDAYGNRIKAAALTGDVGEVVAGGNSKQIVWDLEVDRIEMNADIYVNVHLETIPPPETVVGPLVSHQEKEMQPEQLQKEPESQQEKPEPVKEVKSEDEQSIHHTKKPEEGQSQVVEEESPPYIGEKEYSRTGLIIQSAVCPGLGLSRFKGGPHWIKGVLVYGCTAGSIALNYAAINTYDGIISLSDYDKKNALYEKALSQDQVSEVLAFTAIAIWVSDLVWTLVGTKDLKERYAHQKGIRIKPVVDPVSRSPMLCFNLNF